MKRSAVASAWVALLLHGFLVGQSNQLYFSARQEESQQPQFQNGTASTTATTATSVNQTEPNLGSQALDLRSIPYPSMFPPHDPHGNLRRQQQSQSQPKQTLHLTFQPMPGQPGQVTGQVVPPGTNNGQPPLVNPTVNADIANLQQNLVINPADIQFSVPDVPDSVSQQIIEQIRAQLGNKPVTIGELNNKFVSFTADLPSVLINRTLLTNVEEQTVVEENKSTRTTVISPQGTSYSSSQTTYNQPNPAKVQVSYGASQPIKSHPYNPAAGEGQSYGSRESSVYQTSYSAPVYQYTVPSYGGAYDTTYKKPQSESAGQQQIYQQAPTYQKPKESYQQAHPQPPYQQQQQQQQPKQESTYQQKQSAPAYKQEEPKVIYKYIEVCSYPQQNQQNYQKSSTQTYGQPQSQAHTQSTQKSQQYSAAPSSSAAQPNPYATIATDLSSLQYGNNIGQDIGKLSGEAQHAVEEGYNKMAEAYAKIHEKMAQLDDLQSYVKQLQDQVNGSGFGTIQLPQFPTYGPPISGYQSAPAPYGSTPSYSGTSYSTSSYSAPSAPQNSYASQPQTNYQPNKHQQSPPPQQQSYQSYSLPQNYKSSQSYQPTSQSYTTPKPYIVTSTPASYNVASALASNPQNGNELKLEYKKVEEHYKTVDTQPVITKSSYSTTSGNY